jgi:hypothetical protein
MKKALRLAALVFALLVTGQAAMAVPQIQPAYCGDLCSPEGDARGCLFYRNGALARTTCTCTNGHWLCD